jgi:acyl carrier protein
MNEVEENLQAFLIARAAGILGVSPEQVIWQADIDEYGFDSMEVNRLCVELNEHFDISIQPVIFLQEASSLEGLSSYLLSRYGDAIEAHCL